MAGQPPEPSFQPADRDQGLTQGRPAWQQPTYPPPPASPGAQQAYPAPPAYGERDQARPAQEPGYPAPDPGYAAQDRGYPGYGQDQTYTALGQQPGPGQDYQGQPQEQDYQGYQGYQPPAYGAQPGPGAGMPQWQAGASSAKQAKQPKQAGEKGFLGSLFDFSFSTFVTPKIIKVLYILLTLWTVLVGLIFLVLGFRTGGLVGGLFTLIIVEPIFVLLTLGVYRVILEAFMVVFRIYEETKKIREDAASR